jgi:hypothetical protein
MDPDSDADPDPSIFIIDLQDANKKLIFKKMFSCLLLFEGSFTSFFKDKKSYYIFLMIEGSGSGSRAGSGSVPLTNGSEFRIQEAQKHMDPDPQHWF